MYNIGNLEFIQKCNSTIETELFWGSYVLAKCLVL